MSAPIIAFVGGKPFAVFCSRCRQSSWLLSTFGDGPSALAAATDIASYCCAPRPCPKCAELLAPGSWCQPCREKAEHEKVLRDFATATKVPLAEYKGVMVVGNDEEKYTDTGSIDEYDDPIILDDGTRFVWGTSHETPTVDFERELENWLSEHYEDASEWVDFPKLREAEKLANEALSGIKTYYEDRSIAVIVPAPEVDDDDIDDVDEDKELAPLPLIPVPPSAGIPMLLWCPKCGDRHIDEGEFATKPHSTHACQLCGMVWRPAIEATSGVRFLPGFKNGESK